MFTMMNIKHLEKNTSKPISIEGSTLTNPI